MKDKLENPKETLCLLLYKQPLTIEEISTTLYGSRNSRVSGYIKDLVKKNWIKIELDKQDYRKKVCHVTSKGIFDNINNNIDDLAKYYQKSTLKLTSDEKVKLRTFLNGSAFREFVIGYVDSIDFKKVTNDFSTIIEDLALHCLFLETIDVYYQNKTGIDTTDPNIIKKVLMQLKVQDKEKTERIIEKIEWAKLSLPLISKLANLLKRPSVSTLAWYFDQTIQFVEKTNDLIEKRKIK